MLGQALLLLLLCWVPPTAAAPAPAVAATKELVDAVQRGDAQAVLSHAALRTLVGRVIDARVRMAVAALRDGPNARAEIDALARDIKPSRGLPIRRLDAAAASGPGFRLDMREAVIIGPADPAARSSRDANVTAVTALEEWGSEGGLAPWPERIFVLASSTDFAHMLDRARSERAAMSSQQLSTLLLQVRPSPLARERLPPSLRNAIPSSHAFLC